MCWMLVHLPDLTVRWTQQQCTFQWKYLGSNPIRYRQHKISQDQVTQTPQHVCFWPWHLSFIPYLWPRGRFLMTNRRKGKQFWCASQIVSKIHLCWPKVNLCHVATSLTGVPEGQGREKSSQRPKLFASDSAFWGYTG